MYPDSCFYHLDSIEVRLPSRKLGMATIPQPFLFTWKEIEAASDLDRLRLVLDALPDEELVALLEARRGKGRNDYPVRPTWNALIAGIVFQHDSAASLLRELSRNGELRDLCGFDPVLGAAAVTSDDAFGRFLSVVMDHQEQLPSMFDKLVELLKQELPALGRRLAVDGKALPSFGRPVRDDDKRAEGDRRRDNDADWGTKSYRGTRADGTTWEKVTRWFGFKLHLLVDSAYELPLAFDVTAASRNDCPELLPLVEQLEERHPEIAADAETLAADKGYDSIANNRDLHSDHGIKPVIDKRTLWKDGEPTRALFDDRADSFVYDEDGGVYCACPETGEQRPLSFAGFESDRNCLKYRCPAAACGLDCKGRSECEANAQVGPFGRVIRVPLAKDGRIFTPVARSSYQWQKLYDGRTAVERVNSRLDCVLGFERHTIRGRKKMKMRMTLALAAILAMALGRIRAGQSDQMRSLVAPVARAA